MLDTTDTRSVLEPEISIHWQNANEEWQEFNDFNFLYQDTRTVCTMFEGNKCPVVLHIDDGYICTRNIFPEVRRNHKKVITFQALPDTDAPLYETLNLTHKICVRC